MRSRLLILGFAIAITACRNEQPVTSESEDWNSGHITIACDSNLMPVIGQMKPVYENSYPAAVVDFSYGNEDDLVRRFVAGDLRTIILARMLSPAEKEQAAASQQIDIREHFFAYDAVAVVAGKQYADSVLDLDRVAAMLEKGSPVRLIFDNARSGIAKQVMRLCRIDPEAFRQAYVVNDPQAVIDYVAADPLAIGFIPFNFISNSYEEADRQNRKKIKLLAVSKNDTTYRLSQEDLAYSDYPLKRPLNIVLGNSPDLVGRGFTNFLHRSQAARILLKSGLVPKYMPPRIIRVRETLE